MDVSMWAAHPTFTRMIMAWQKCSPGSFPCYTFGGVRRECQDVILARQVARMCGQPHEVISVGTEFLTEFPRYAERSVLLTDGCVDVGRAPDLYPNDHGLAEVFSRIISLLHLRGSAP